MATAAPEASPFTPAHAFYREFVREERSLTVNVDKAHTPSAVRLDNDTVVGIVDLLKARGPFAALASVGPDAYFQPPALLNDEVIHSKDIPEEAQGMPIHFWPPGTPKKPSPARIEIIVIGATQDRDNEKNIVERVFYVRARMLSVSDDKSNSPFKRFQIVDSKVYVNSFRTFRIHADHLFVPLTAEEQKLV
ncbi:hypothetical protein JYU14_01310 [Simkania negevensis]|uniref:Uncharacterized protein n=1 Tax=Simkania negevensis TaxID=83561 RepID=A0ABS3AQU1_9BACT|nr:hypothetical protein [Simkania negevensis]